MVNRVIPATFSDKQLDKMHQDSISLDRNTSIMSVTPNVAVLRFLLPTAVFTP